MKRCLRGLNVADGVGLDQRLASDRVGSDIETSHPRVLGRIEDVLHGSILHGSVRLTDIATILPTGLTAASPHPRAQKRDES
ncbi:MAG: hypothetical protein H0U74_05565 [Bradymonadaceae bacterium]|nr:hypothetical protein [Lujinxingiaceae bacterium]